MKIHQLSIDDALASVRSSAGGLSSSEAERRQREFGLNRGEKVAGEPVWWRLLKEFMRFFSVILWCAAGLSFLAEWFDPGQGTARIGYAIIAVILISGVFSFWQEYRIEQTLAALQKLLPQQVSALRDGMIVRLPAEQIVIDRSKPNCGDLDPPILTSTATPVMYYSISYELRNSRCTQGFLFLCSSYQKSRGKKLFAHDLLGVCHDADSVCDRGR